MSLTQIEPEVTVVFLLYNAERTVDRLLDLILAQTHPQFSNQKQWLKVIFNDDASKDNTLGLLRDGLKKIGNPDHVRINANSKNLGLSESINQLLINHIKTPFVLTCHLDCFFSNPDYVSKMLELIKTHPNAATITGRQDVDLQRNIPFPERVNLVANLMDVVNPPHSHTEKELISIGFAEGRCDIFRLEALKKIGFHDTTLRTAGEDQVLCGRLREAGYEIFQAPGCQYDLSVSAEQDSLKKLFHHQRLFGRVHPYIFVQGQGSRAGVVGRAAGPNRQSRSILRLQQTLATATYLIAPLFPVVLAFTFVFKWFLFRKHFALIPFSFAEKVAFYLYQPIFDVGYTVGLFEGLVFLLLRRLGAQKTI